MRLKTVIAIVGLPTSGKTTLGRELSKATGIHFVDIDEGPLMCTPRGEEKPYGSHESRVRTRARYTIAYSVLHAAVEANLCQGNSLIIAAPYTRHTSQDYLRGAVDRAGGFLLVIWCQYNDTPDELELRIADRLAHHSIGGCRSISHYLSDKKDYEGIKFPHIVVRMEGGHEGLHHALQQALRHIEHA